MRLLIISNMYPSAKVPVYGTFVQAFVRQMEVENADGKTDYIVIRGLEGCKAWKYACFYMKVLFSLLLHKYDLIYVHTITHTAPPIRLAAMLKRLPLVFNVHGNDVLTLTPLAKRLREMARPLLAKAKMVVVPSRFFEGIMLREFPELSAGRLYISPSGGVGKNFLSYGKRAGHGTEWKGNVIGYVSRIDYGKGWQTFLHAIALLRDQGVRCQAIMVGRGEEVDKMLRLREELGLSDTVSYRGPMPPDKLPEVYASMDVFVFPTQLEESLGLVGLEAMACRRVVIGSRIGGLTDYIRDGENGFFFEPGNAKDLAESLKRFLSLPVKQRQEMEAEAFRTAQEYDSQSASHRLYKKLQSLL